MRVIDAKIDLLRRHEVARRGQEIVAEQNAENEEGAELLQYRESKQDNLDGAMEQRLQAMRLQLYHDLDTQTHHQFGLVAAIESSAAAEEMQIEDLSMS